MPPRSLGWLSGLIDSTSRHTTPKAVAVPGNEAVERSAEPTARRSEQEPSKPGPGDATRLQRLADCLLSAERFATRLHPPNGGGDLFLGETELLQPVGSERLPWPRCRTAIRPAADHPVRRRCTEAALAVKDKHRKAVPGISRSLERGQHPPRKVSPTRCSSLDSGYRPEPSTGCRYAGLRGLWPGSAPKASAVTMTCLECSRPVHVPPFRRRVEPPSSRLGPAVHRNVMARDE